MDFPDDYDKPRMTGIGWLNRIPGYSYYDTPEGEDCPWKVGYMAKLGIYVGISTATLDCVLISKPVGLANIVGRYAAITSPLVAVGTTFATATCLSTSLRGVDDSWNYSFGGAMAGAVFGACFRSGTLGTATGAFLAFCGYTKKQMDISNFALYNTEPHVNATAWSGPWGIKWDLSIIEDKGPKGWKTSDD